MRLSSIGGGVGDSDEGLLGVWRELRVADRAGVAEVFAGGKMRSGGLRGESCRCSEGEKSEKNRAA